VWRQEAGLLFYFQDIGLGTSDGYTATYSAAYQQLYISRITDEVDLTVAELGTGAIALDSSHRYRLVVSSHDGTTFLFQLFDKSEPNSPWASAIGQDSAYNITLGFVDCLYFSKTCRQTLKGRKPLSTIILRQTRMPGRCPPPSRTSVLRRRGR